MGLGGLECMNRKGKESYPGELPCPKRGETIDGKTWQTKMINKNVADWAKHPHTPFLKKELNTYVGYNEKASSLGTADESEAPTAPMPKLLADRKKLPDWASELDKASRWGHK